MVQRGSGGGRVAQTYQPETTTFLGVCKLLLPIHQGAKLEGLFTSAPVLTQPDPSHQFIMKVDVSDSGVGAVLSQRSAPDQRPSL